MTSKSQTHIGIVGGGIIGLCAAYFLVQRGHSVTVLEAETLGSGASRGNGGQLVPAKPLPAPGMVADGLKHWFSKSSAFYINPLDALPLAPFLIRFALSSTHRRYERGIDHLRLLNDRTFPLLDEMAQAGIGSKISSAGNLRAFASRKQADADRATAIRLWRRGFHEKPLPMMSPGALHDYEPTISSAASWGYVQPGLRWGDPSVFVDELIDWLRDAGVTLVEGTPVSAITSEATGITVRQASRASVFDQVVVTAGAWSRRLMKPLGVRLNMVPGLGYSFTVDAKTTPKHTLILEDAHVGVTPMGRNRIRIAGTMELSRRFAGEDATRIAAIVEAAKPFLLDADWDAITDVWAAPRPMTFDGLPYIGATRRDPRIIAATGHNMLGFSLAPATGEYVSRLVSGDINAKTNPYRLNR